MSNIFRQHTLTSIKRIKDASEHNKLVIFVGAGVSMNSGLPSWSDVVASMAEDLGILNKDDNKEYCFSNDDYLKIPQYYYNERKENEYCSKVISLFNKDCFPNPIHKLIFSLNPSHIITTNYDDLLEKTLKQSNIHKYCKVACDEDLAIAPNANYIIKMHGELKNCHNSFVLKESDYDSYSSNFTLLETFVKGVIATNTLLFIGFSASDGNVRRIFQWIHDIVGEKNRPAYLIDINSVLSEGEVVKYNYLKRQGIVKLFYNQIPEDKLKNYENDLDKPLPEDGLKLYKFLKFISDYSEEVDSISVWYEKLKILNDFAVTRNVANAVFETDVFNRIIFGRSFQFESPKMEKDFDAFRIKLFIYLFSEKNIVNFFLLRNNTFLQDYSALVDKVCNRVNYDDFSSANESFRNTSLEEYEKLLSFINEKFEINNQEKGKIAFIYNVLEQVDINSKKMRDEVISYFLYDFPGNYKRLDNNPSNLDLLHNSFYCFITANYSNSMELLNRIDSYISPENAPVLFYLVKFNKKVCANFQNYFSRFSSDKNIDKDDSIRDSLSIDLDYILNNRISDSLKTIVSKFSLAEISSYLYDFEKYLKQLSDYKKIVENSGSGLNGYIQNSLKAFNELINFVISNCVFITAYSETKFLFYLFTKILFTSYTTTESQNARGVIPFPVNKLISFSAINLCTMIRFLPNKDLRNLINEFGIEEIKLTNGVYEKKTNSIESFSDKTFLIRSFHNFLELARKNQNIQVDDTVSNYFTIFEYVKSFENGDLEEIIGSIIDFSVSCFKYSFGMAGGYYNFYTQICSILIRILRKISCGFYVGTISFVVYKKIILFITNESNLNFFIKASFLSVLELVTECLKNASQNIYSKNNANDETSIQITELIKLLITKQTEYRCDSFLINIYKYVSNEDRAIIKVFFLNNYSEITPTNCYVFYCAVSKNVIDFSSDTENKLFCLLEQHFDSFAVDDFSAVKKFHHNFVLFYNLLCALSNFVSDGYITNNRRVKKFLKKIAPFFKTNNFREDSYHDARQIVRILKMTTDSKNLDFSETTLDDYFYLSDNTLEKLGKDRANIGKIRKIILNASDNKKRFSNQERFNKICEILFGI